MGMILFFLILLFLWQGTYWIGVDVLEIFKSYSVPSPLGVGRCYLQRNIKPIILGIQTLPSVCWVPFSILWFGLSTQAILFVVVMGSAFGIAISVDNAIKNIPVIYTRAALTMGASRRQMYCYVLFPACLPEMIAGLKQGWSFAWRALMAGEVMTTSIGLGQTLIMGRDLADINQVMLVMIVIVVVGIVIDKCIFSVIERHVLGKRGLQK